MEFEGIIRFVAQAMLRFGGFAAGGFLFGLPVIARVVVAPALLGASGEAADAARERMAHRLEGLVQAALWTAGLAALLTVLLQSLLSAELRGGLLDAQLFDSVVESSAGRWQLLRLPLTAALAVILVGRVRQGVLARDGRPRRMWWALWLILGAALLFTNSLAGHAASSQPVGLILTNDLLHLMSGSIWFTGIVVLASVLPRGTRKMNADERLEVATPMIARFADVALASIAIVAGTGTLNSLVNVARPNDLIDSGYGRALAAKLVLFIGVLALGGINHFYVRRRLERARSVGSAARIQSMFRKTIAVELALAIGLMGMTGVLVGSERTRSEALPDAGPTSRRAP